MTQKSVYYATLCALGLSLSCVPENAGYADVRKVTNARLHTEARWNSQDGAPTQQVQSLLARPLTAEQVGKIAVLNSPRLQAEFEKLGVARAQWVSALQLPNPVVGAALVYGIDDSPELDLDASMNVTGLLQLASRSGVMSAQLQATVQAIAHSALEIAFDARRAFVEYQVAVAELDLRETITASWSASAGMATQLFELGNVPELRRVNEQAFYEEMRVQQARASARVKAAREHVNARLGLWGMAGAQWTVDKELLPAPQTEADIASLVRDLESQAIAQSLGLAASRLRYEAAAKQANLIRFAGWFPQVHAGVRVARQQPDGEGVQWGAGPLVEVGVPLFYQGQGESGAALAEMRRQEALIDDIAIRTRSASRSATARLKTAAQMATHYREHILPLRGQVVEQTQLQYNAMSVGVFELLQAKNMEIGAHLSYLDIVKDYSLARLDVEQLLAGGLASADGLQPQATPSISGVASSVAHD
jgi:outer membrane protein, heavy metal efflux system